MIKSYIWVIDCIKSCKNEFQLECCRQLIKFFEDRYIKEENCARSLDSLYSILDATSILMSESTDVIN